MVSAWAGLAAVPAIALHLICRRPAGFAGPIAIADGRFALPDEGRRGLALVAGTRAGPGWILLVFADHARPPLLLLRDQFDPPAWRILGLAVRERS